MPLALYRRFSASKEYTTLGAPSWVMLPAASPKSGARYEYRTGGGAKGKTICMEPPSPAVLPGDERPSTVREAAALLGVSQQTVDLWVEEKKIPHLRVLGRNIRFLRSDLETFRASLKQEVERY
jgi:excisionase family DNA binding protein